MSSIISEFPSTSTKRCKKISDFVSIQIILMKIPIGKSTITQRPTFPCRPMPQSRQLPTPPALKQRNRRIKCPPYLKLINYFLALFLQGNKFQLQSSSKSANLPDTMSLLLPNSGHFIGHVWRPVFLRAFSLVELLVALAIVMIFAAFLFPVIYGAASASNNAKCIGNLRAIAGALHAYIADNNGVYPPNRNRPVGERKFPSEALIKYIPTPTTITIRQQAGPWFCPSDKDRPMSVSAKSYGQHSRLGAEDRTPEAKNPSWQPWWSKASASDRSGKLIYLIDHNLQNSPLSTAGNFSEKSWPLQNGVKGQPPSAGSGDSLVDFDRHNGHANALFVDGSVRSMDFDDFKGTRWLYVDPTR